MALQGTIDSFPLTEVLTLLASSKKSGRLALDGDRGSAALWISDGEVVGGDMVGGGGATAASLLFEMLRFSDASFAFDAAPADSEPQHSVEVTPLNAAMDEAAALLTEWDDIVAVVPSLAHRVVLVEQLPEDSVTLDAASWSLVIAAAADPVVAVIGDALGLDEFGACAAAASLVERGLATMAEPATFDLSNAEVGGRFIPEVAETRSIDDKTTGGPADHASSDRPSIDLADLSDLTGRPSDDGPVEPRFPERFPIDDLLGGDASDTADAWGTPEPAPFENPAFDSSAFDSSAFDSSAFDAPAQVDDRPTSAGPDTWEDLLSGTDRPADSVAGSGGDEVAADLSDDADDSTDEVLRQMSKLSPQAAEAIAAALSSVPATAPAQEPSSTSGDADGDGDGPVTFSGMF